jgi:hypothetical protein
MPDVGILFLHSYCVHRLWPNKVAGANDGWPSQFRFAGNVVVSVMAQIRMLGGFAFTEYVIPLT